MKWTLVLSLFVFCIWKIQAHIEPPCSSEIYCTGNLLKSIQLARLFKDSKTFVDMSIRNGNTAQSVLDAFNKLENPTRDDLRFFVQKYFVEGNELEDWYPEDWIPNPSFLESIKDAKLYNWGNKLNQFWNKLGRKIKKEVKEYPERFSIIYVSNGIIVPGGRFREFYYWDSYWIQIGLLHSEMDRTVQGMIENFLEIVQHDNYGFVPNGGRVYYRRTQPPLLIPMVRNYVNYIKKKKNNGVVAYLNKVLPTLDKEFMFWINNRLVDVTDQNNNIHQLAIFNSTQNEPRPESYREDYELGHSLPEPEKTMMYTDLHSGAESGWDFSSRWWTIPEGKSGNLGHTRTTNVIPADLNAYIYLNAVILAQFYTEIGNTTKATEYNNYASKFREAIMSILWDEQVGSWFDYDIAENQRRKTFYISNIIPLWAGVNDAKVDRIVEYLSVSGALKYPGGIPTSLKQTGEQWDYPNGWAPMEHLVVDALAKSSSKVAQDLAFDIAKKWTLGNFKLYDKKGIMLEKYDVATPGTAGGGGEYEVVIGFGWTNGVILDFLARYGETLQVPPTEGLGGGTSQLMPLAIPLVFLGSLIVSIQTSLFKFL